MVSILLKNLTKPLINTKADLDAKLDYNTSTPTYNRNTPKGRERNKLMMDMVKVHVKKVISVEQLILYLTKEAHIRSRIEKDSISRCLLETYQYFQQYKDDPLKLDKLINAIRIEHIKANKPIITYGEEGDKFYVLLKGKVAISKPDYIPKDMCLNEFIEYLKDIKLNESTPLKFQRLKEKNNTLRLDLDLLVSMENLSQRRTVFSVFIEQNTHLAVKEDGFAFGEIALIKRAPRNATITSVTDCILATIEKADYNRVIREYEEKRLEKTLLDFKKKYSPFAEWTLSHLIRLFNCFTKIELQKGEFIYKQDEESDSIYMLESGTVNVFAKMSYNWIDDYYSYIIDSKTNLIYLLGTYPSSLRETELNELLAKTNSNVLPSPFQYDPLKPDNIIISYPKRNNLVDMIKEEDQLYKPHNLIKIDIKTVSMPEVFGFVECCEVKRRFASVKVVSSHAVFNRVKMNDLYHLLNHTDDFNKKFMLDHIAEIKQIYTIQLRRNVDNKTQIIEKRLDCQYENAITENKKDPSIKRLYEKVKCFGRYDRDNENYINTTPSSDSNYIKSREVKNYKTIRLPDLHMKALTEVFMSSESKGRGQLYTEGNIIKKGSHSVLNHFKKVKSQNRTTEYNTFCSFSPNKPKKIDNGTVSTAVNNTKKDDQLLQSEKKVKPLELFTPTSSLMSPIKIFQQQQIGDTPNVKPFKISRHQPSQSVFQINTMPNSNDINENNKNNFNTSASKHNSRNEKKNKIIVVSESLKASLWLKNMLKSKDNFIHKRELDLFRNRQLKHQSVRNTTQYSLID